MTLHFVLTGGVASGKSAVSRFFAELGVRVIDADIVAREVVELGSKGLQAITQYFGEDVLLDDGSLDRKALRDIVFSDDSKRHWLNQLLHPMIRDKMLQARSAAESLEEPYTVSVIPLYFETIHGTDEAQNYQRVLVVDVDEGKQLSRLMRRDDTDIHRAKALMASQASRSERLSIADDVIANNSDLQSLKQQVINLDKHYRELARS